MATLRTAIWSILLADAQLDTGTELGTLLGHTGTAPYGLYWGWPPENPDLPVLVMRILAESDRRPRNLQLELIAFGENYEAILKRARTLLHDVTVTPDDFTHLMCKWDGASPELFDDDLKSRMQSHRYWLKGWTT